MTHYVDKKGKEYTLMKGFEEGDFVLFSEDDKAFIFDKTQLSEASHFFRDMFTLNAMGEGDLELHLALQSTCLHAFLTAVRNPTGPTSSDWATISTVIDPARRFECESLPRDILYSYCRNDPGSYRLEAFIIASELDHLLAAARILLSAQNAEVPSYIRGCGYGKSMRSNGDSWTARDSNRLSQVWLHALTCSVARADKDFLCLDPENEKYWVAVAGEFLRRMMKMCESAIAPARNPAAWLTGPLEPASVMRVTA